MRAAALMSALALGACAGASVPVEDGTREGSDLFATRADPQTYLPRPGVHAQTGAPVGAASIAGAERARRLLVELTLAIRDGDEPGVERLLAERIAIAPAARRGGRPAPSIARAAWVRQLVAQARVAGLHTGTPFEEMVVPESIRVEPAVVFFPDELPPELAPSDLVLRFDLAPAGRRGLASLAPGGSGTLVVRTSDEARVIAR